MVKKQTQKNAAKEGSAKDIMADAEYLRKSSDLIREALQDGFDILQLENGDIVTTGVKTIVTTYRWDPKARKMKKVAAKQRKTAANPQDLLEIATKKPQPRKPGKSKKLR